MIAQFDISLLLDICLLVMLGVAIGYCFVLNRKLNHLRTAQGEMREIAKGFDQAIVRSKLGVQTLKSLSETKGTELRAEISKAEKLAQELEVMNASGSRIADRMQSASDETKGIFRTNSAEDNVSPLAVAAVSTPDDAQQREEIQFRTDAEKELIQALTKADG